MLVNRLCVFGLIGVFICVWFSAPELTLSVVFFTAPSSSLFCFCFLKVSVIARSSTLSYLLSFFLSCKLITVVSI